MLKKLTILNGELSIKFNSLNTRYTVNMTTNEEELKLEYEIDEKDNISIYNNHLENDKTEVVITVYNDEESMSYYLEVYKMQEKLVEKEEDYFASLEVKTDTYNKEYVAPLIAGICFLIILFLFTVLFKKRKNAK